MKETLREPTRSRDLSPFVGLLRASVDEALTALLAPPSGTRLRWALDGDAIAVDLEGHHGAIALSLAGFQGSAGRLKLGERPTRSGASPSPRLRRSVRAAMSLDPEIIGGALRRLDGALGAWRPFAQMRDTQFRQINPAPAGDHGTLRLGYRCNQDCLFCWQGRQWPAPPIERYWAWLDELAALGVKDVHFTGGEATTWSELPALITRAVAVHGMVVSVQTNAIRLAHPRYLRSLVDAGLTAIQVSYHSADPLISDRITRAPGTHKKTRAGVQAALEAGLVATLTCVVEQDTVAGLPAQAADIVAAFVEPFPDNPVRRVTYAHPTSYFEDGLWEARQVSFGVVRAPLVAACRTLFDAGIPVQIAGPCGFPNCLLTGHEDLIDSQMVERRIFTPDELSHRHYADVCEGCSHKSGCFGLRQEYLDRFGDAGLQPFKSATSD